MFLAGVTGRQVTPHYWERILPKLDPRVLVPTHYDDFFAPLGRPLKLIRQVDLEGVPDEVARGHPRRDGRRAQARRLTRSRAAAGHSGNANVEAGVRAAVPGRRGGVLSTSSVSVRIDEGAELEHPARRRQPERHALGLAQRAHELRVRQRVRRGRG